MSITHTLLSHKPINTSDSVLTLSALQTLLSESQLPLSAPDEIWQHFSSHSAFHMNDLLLPLVLNCAGTLKQKLNVLFQVYSSMERKRGVSIEKLRRVMDTFFQAKAADWLES